MGQLDGQVALVTGAGGGIGRAHALLLAKQGAAVVVNDLGGNTDGTGEGTAMADQVVDLIKSKGGKAAADYGSVSNPDDAKAMVKKAVDEFGKLDICINNAGILRDKARVCRGIRLYSSSRMTEGTLTTCLSECTASLPDSSAAATPFNISTRARRAAHTLIGSYVALSTSTGVRKTLPFGMAAGYLPLRSIPAARPVVSARAAGCIPASRIPCLLHPSYINDTALRSGDG